MLKETVTQQTRNVMYLFLSGKSVFVLYSHCIQETKEYPSVLLCFKIITEVLKILSGQFYSFYVLCT